MQDCKPHELLKYSKKYSKKYFCHRISELIEWCDPEFVKDILQDLNNKNENSDCPTCDESDEDAIVVKSRKKYSTKMWTCPACNVTCTTKNRLNHERCYKHQNMVKEICGDHLTTTSSSEKLGVVSTPNSLTLNNVDKIEQDDTE